MVLRLVPRLVLLPAFLLTVSTALCCAQETRTTDGTPLAKITVEDGDCIVFLGDSITHQRLYTQYVEDFFYTRFPGVRLKFHNSGVGGAQAWDALQRFDQDVAAYKPRYVTVLLGMNDGRYQPYNEEIFRKYQTDMTMLIERINQIGATPILMTPTMFDSRAARARKGRWQEPTLDLYNSVLTYYGTWLREVATNQGYGYVDMWGPLNNLTLQQRRTDPSFTMIRDAVHPDAPGQVVMAYALIDHLGLRGAASNIRVVRGPNNRARVTGNGKGSEAQFTDDGLRFTWLAPSLPWVLPEEAQPGADLVKLGHRASRDGLEVHGLEPGNYELLIDDQSVGTWTHIQLARHIELQSNEKTPQYQQALAVAKLNKERNSGPIGALRNEWRAFQQYARLKRDHAAAPDKEKQQRIATLEKRLEGREERIAAAESAARALEDQIFETNQPRPHTWVLRRVKE